METADLCHLVAAYAADCTDLDELSPISSPTGRRRRRQLIGQWQKELSAIDFSGLPTAAQVDVVLLHLDFAKSLRRLDLDDASEERRSAFVPFAARIVDLEEARVRMDSIHAPKAADDLNELAKAVTAARSEVAALQNPDPHIADEAVLFVDELCKALERWYTFYAGYDPLFTWWVAAPFKVAAQQLTEFSGFLKEEVVGVKPGDTTKIVGHPVGREALLADLAAEMIPYGPEELMEAAARDYAWCEGEMRRAASDLGFGDDWAGALEHVKSLHVDPGEQPALVKQLALEAIEFVESRDLVTVPSLAKETLRMEMMSAERQLVNPFFLGGPLIIVSYPTSEMSHEAKLMSMRGNNRHFARATVQHELIPGHHLQHYARPRYRAYRRPFWTPFWVEGWAVYWEMLLWELGFPQSPEDRIGMLFWRMHRCARVEFSLKFHLGKMSAEACIDLLVDKVGHERLTAEGEVRRSFGGEYPALYQAAYLIGALQVRALARELVDSGRMTRKAFHDSFLQQNCIPVALVRAALTGQVPSPGGNGSWRFLDAAAGGAD